MGHEFRYLWQVESRRLIWLIGMVFAVVLAVQYFELPYGNVLASLFSVVKVPNGGNNGFQTSNSSIYKSQVAENTTVLNGLSYTDVYTAHEIGNNTETSEGKDGSPSNDSVSDRNRGPNKSLGSEDDGDPEDEVPSESLEDLNENSAMENVKISDNGPAPEKAREPEHSFSLKNVTGDYNSSLGNIQEEGMALPSKNSGSSNADFAPLSPAIPPVISSPNITFPSNLDTKSGTPIISVNLNTSSGDKDAVHTLNMDEKPKSLQKDNSSIANVPPVKKKSEKPLSAVVSISDMNDLLLQSRASYRSMKPRWSSAVDQELLDAKSQIEKAPIIKNDPRLYAPLYRNVSMFKRSYELMEQTLKVYVYREGGRPVFHQPVLKGIYASEGWFLKLLEANKKIVTKNPKKAHLFYLPFSSRNLEEALYVPNSHSHKNLIQYLKNYLDSIVAKHPFWNRTGGADHFLVACHDWAPAETKQHMASCIRALCNSDIREGFKFGKDVSLPETYVRSPQNLLRDLGGKPPSQRSILAFFAGSMHGYLRPILLQHWENKDPDMKIFGRMARVKGKMNYVQHMKSSKYCICAKGYEVNSPRVVEAIFYECVPVIISDNFVPPFFEVLNWESFAVFVSEKDIPNLKKILLSISEKRYLQMQRRVKKVQQHFLWHARPVKYDIFHMILHSVWYNRVFQILPRK